MTDLNRSTGNSGGPADAGSQMQQTGKLITSSCRQPRLPTITATPASTTGSHTRGRGRAYAAGLYFSHPEGAETPAQGEPLHVLWWEGPLHFYLSSERADSPVAQEIEVSQTASSPHRLQPLLRAGLLRVLKSEPP